MMPDSATILIVDDNAAIRDMLVTRVSRQGHRVLQAENGMAALETVRAQPIDLILLDIMMPGMNGYQVLEQLKADPALRHIPVIVISALEELDSIVRCIELGAEDYLTKPFKSLLLKARIDASLERKRLHDALAEANNAKSEFVAMVSHELKTPMTAIKGYADLLASGAAGPANEEQADFLHIIRANIERMAALVSDLTDISRVEAGHLYLEPERVALAEVVAQVVRSIEGQIEAKRQTLTAQIPDTLPPVWADRRRVIQILTNLVSNAHKYTPAGGQITILAEYPSSRREAGDSAAVVQLSVRDSGIGIAPEEQAKIFSKFFRSKDGAVRDEAGTGLGLSITKSLVNVQGGQIWFESEFSRGTTFHFTLPAAEDGVAPA